MFLLCTNKNGKQMAVAASSIACIEEAPDEERKKDVRVCSVIHSIWGNQRASVGVQESFTTLLNNFHADETQ